MPSTLLGLSGSLRKASTNKRLLNEAARLFGPDQYVEANLDIPLYNGDVENIGIPDSVQLLADQIAAADAIVISSPEYNQSISGVMKNALDWVSRVEGNPWQGKPVVLLAAAAGRSGGARASYALRLAMTPFKAKLIQGELLLASSQKEFDENGRLKSEQYLKSLTALMNELRTLAGLS